MYSLRQRLESSGEGARVEGNGLLYSRIVRVFYSYDFWRIGAPSSAVDNSQPNVPDSWRYHVWLFRVLAGGPSSTRPVPPHRPDEDCQGKRLRWVGRLSGTDVTGVFFYARCGWSGGLPVPMVVSYLCRCCAFCFLRAPCCEK